MCSEFYMYKTSCGRSVRGRSFSLIYGIGTHVLFHEKPHSRGTGLLLYNATASVILGKDNETNASVEEDINY